jgi:hypothetical protein
MGNINEQATSTATIQNAGMSRSNYDYASVLQIRLNTQPILDQIHTYLSGSYKVLAVNKKGEPFEKEMKTGEPIANQVGIQRIMSYLQSVFNPQVVQANFDREMYENYLSNHRRILAVDIMINLRRYGMKAKDVNGLMNLIYSLKEPFLTRPLANKERESYDTMKVVENTSSVNRGGLGAKMPFQL